MFPSATQALNVWENVTLQMLLPGSLQRGLLEQRLGYCQKPDAPPLTRALVRAARVSPETSMYLSLQGKKEGAGAVAGAGAPVVQVCVKVAGGGKCAKAAGATCAHRVGKSTA